MSNEVEQTRRWISSMVIGLNLCPFAARVFNADLIRYVVSEVTEPAELVADLANELQALASTPITTAETTILIHPNVLEDFLDYNDFLGIAEDLIQDLGLRGVIQVVGFHPGYLFEGAAPEAAENYTNRSPYPMLHLLREQSITDLGASTEELLEIPRRNIETLNKLGRDKILQMLRAGSN